VVTVGRRSVQQLVTKGKGLHDHNSRVRPTMATRRSPPSRGLAHTPACKIPFIIIIIIIIFGYFIWMTLADDRWLLVRTSFEWDQCFVRGDSAVGIHAR
jgi:hypothetical protein